MSKTSVVVVGGGYAGSAIARALSAKLDAAKYNLILINNRPFNIYRLGSARMVVSSHDKLEEKALIPFDNIFINGNGSLKVETVTAIEKTHGKRGGNVVLLSGENVSFDVLVLAPGSTWAGPLDFPDGEGEVTTFIKQWRDRFEQAQHVVLGGGGAVGIGALPASISSQIY
jgi:NADH dehydrogenase FAD-containing subunit